MRTAIYFLWAGQECVYVGQSTDADTRHKGHIGRIAFDRVTFMDCREIDLAAFEAKFIAALQPKFNDMQPKGRALPSVPRPGGCRFATLDELIKSHLPNFLSPVPSAETLRDWFTNARVPRIKANPSAKRGGGPVYYQVAAVERLVSRVSF